MDCPCSDAEAPVGWDQQISGSTGVYRLEVCVGIHMGDNHTHKECMIICIITGMRRYGATHMSAFRREMRKMN